MSMICAGGPTIAGCRSPHSRRASRPVRTEPELLSEISRLCGNTGRGPRKCSIPASGRLMWPWPRSSPSNDNYLRAAWPNPGAAAPTFPDSHRDVGCTGLPANRHPGHTGAPTQTLQRQHRIADQVPPRPARPTRRRSGHADLGRAVHPSAQGHQCLDDHQTALGCRGTTSRIRTRAQPGRTRLGQRQSNPTG